jgi:hypothetical protein
MSWGPWGSRESRMVMAAVLAGAADDVFLGQAAGLTQIPELGGETAQADRGRGPQGWHAGMTTEPDHSQRRPPRPPASVSTCRHPCRMLPGPHPAKTTSARLENLWQTPDPPPLLVSSPAMT